MAHEDLSNHVLLTELITEPNATAIRNRNPDHLRTLQNLSQRLEVYPSYVVEFNATNWPISEDPELLDPAIKIVQSFNVKIDRDFEVAEAQRSKAVPLGYEESLSEVIEGHFERLQNGLVEIRAKITRLETELAETRAVVAKSLPSGSSQHTRFLNDTGVPQAGRAAANNNQRDMRSDAKRPEGPREHVPPFNITASNAPKAQHHAANIDSTQKDDQRGASHTGEARSQYGGKKLPETIAPSFSALPSNAQPPTQLSWPIHTFGGFPIVAGWRDPDVDKTNPVYKRMSLLKKAHPEWAANSKKLPCVVCDRNNVVTSFRNLPDPLNKQIKALEGKVTVHWPLTSKEAYLEYNASDPKSQTYNQRGQRAPSNVTYAPVQRADNFEVTPQNLHIPGQHMSGHSSSAGPGSSKTKFIKGSLTNEGKRKHFYFDASVKIEEDDPMRERCN